MEISDKFLEVNAFNSNRFDPKLYAGWEDQGTNGKEEPETTWEVMDMVRRTRQGWRRERHKRTIRIGKGSQAP